ncbi:hypothetical protein [Nostoc sp.]|uniref:hypothetical protein n=1 Tax=Nostoc sp. TaxID=1180 RepID=UPI002FFA5710
MDFEPHINARWRKCDRQKLTIRLSADGRRITIQKSSACFGSCDFEPQINTDGRS